MESAALGEDLRDVSGHPILKTSGGNAGARTRHLDRTRAGGTYDCEARCKQARRSRRNSRRGGVVGSGEDVVQWSRDPWDSFSRASGDARYAGVSCPSQGRTRSKCDVDSDRRSGHGAPSGARVARIPRRRGEAGTAADTRFRIGRTWAAGGAGRGTRGGGDRRGGAAAVARTAGVRRELGPWRRSAARIVGPGGASDPATDPDPGAHRCANHGRPRPTPTVGVGPAAPVAPCPGTIRGTPARPRRRARN